MAQEKPAVDLKMIEGGTMSKNKAHTLMEVEHAYDLFRKEGVHGEVRIIFADKGKAKRLCRTVNINLEDD